MKDEDAFEMARLLTDPGRESFAESVPVRRCGGRYEKAKEMDRGVMVTLFPDGGEKYVSTPLYEPSKCFECLKRNQIPTCMTEEYITALECLVKNGG